MSKTIDDERTEQARLARIDRAQRLLEELLVLVKARREPLPINVTAIRMQRHRNTVARRGAMVDEVIAVLDKRGNRSDR